MCGEECKSECCKKRELEERNKKCRENRDRKQRRNLQETKDMEFNYPIETDL